MTCIYILKINNNNIGYYFDFDLARDFLYSCYYANFIKDTDNVHLLGCAIPQEFAHYRNMPFITTIDTSNPIMAAIEGTLYEPYGLDQKPKTKIDEVIDSKFDKSQIGKVIMNTKYFRTINGI